MVDQISFSGPFKFVNGVMFCFRPAQKDFIEVRLGIKLKTEPCPPSALDLLTFRERRISLMRSAEFSEEDRARLLQPLIDQLKRDLDANINDSEVLFEILAATYEQQTAYGCYYNVKDLQYVNSTAIIFDAINAPSMGSTKNESIYLTATNRSKLGAEAYLAYFKDDPPKFRIFDWSYPGGYFALCSPHDALSEYIHTRNVDGKDYETLSIVNSTRRRPDNHWVNEVLLFNAKYNVYDFIYSNSFPADHAGYYKWGPIIETSAEMSFYTNSIGFFDAYIMQD